MHRYMIWCKRSDTPRTPTAAQGSSWLYPYEQPCMAETQWIGWPPKEEGTCVWTCRLKINNIHKTENLAAYACRGRVLVFGMHAHELYIFLSGNCLNTHSSGWPGTTGRAHILYVYYMYTYTWYFPYSHIQFVRKQSQGTIANPCSKWKMGFAFCVKKVWHGLTRISIKGTVNRTS